VSLLLIKFRDLQYSKIFMELLKHSILYVVCNFFKKTFLTISFLNSKNGFFGNFLLLLWIQLFLLFFWEVFPHFYIKKMKIKTFFIFVTNVWQQSCHTKLMLWNSRIISKDNFLKEIKHYSKGFFKFMKKAYYVLELNQSSSSMCI
jgi:hypothetical protein